MGSFAIFKRILPFLATFAVGIFIASFFVTVTAPSFRSDKCKKRGFYAKQLRSENERLRNENLRLKNELESQAIISEDLSRIAHRDFDGRGPEFPVDAPPPPPLPKRVR